MVATGSAAGLDFVAVGNGPGVLLIHGTGADAMSNWGRLMDTVGGRYRVVAPNLPGAGGTPPASGSLDTDMLVGQLLATADAAGLEDPVHVVGHSLGAVLAAAVAAKAPARVRSLLLHAGWVTSGPRERLLFDLWGRLLGVDTVLLARTLVLSAMSPALLSGLGQDDLDALVAGFEGLVDERIAGQIDLDRRVDIAPLLPLVEAPTLVVASADDQILPSAHQRTLAAAIAGATYREVPGGHGLPFEDSAGFAAMIAEHLDSQERVSR